MNHQFGIRIAKDRFKFSCSHMTIFPDNTAERLHGHNYRVRVELTGPEAPNGMLYDPRPLKKALSLLCEELDEKCLLPLNNPNLKIEDDGKDNFNLILFDKKYSLPKDDTRLIQLPNITMEALADYFIDRLIEELQLINCSPSIINIRVEVEESQGQLVWCERDVK